MKPTWTKVYHGPGYPLDPRRDAIRGWIDVATWQCVLNQPPRPNALYLDDIFDMLHRFRASRPQPDTIEIHLPTTDDRTRDVMRLGIDNIHNPEGRAERKRKQISIGQMFVKYGCQTPY